mmetsp:Transcript_23022/g.65892  ORF Transcript_23022/g.65892 Transcript_23022/m.65892 type:complete len:260 (-) Transcript_23022:1388-2167(-)
MLTNMRLSIHPCVCMSVIIRADTWTHQSSHPLSVCRSARPQLHRRVTCNSFLCTDGNSTSREVVMRRFLACTELLGRSSGRVHVTVERARVEALGPLLPVHVVPSLPTAIVRIPPDPCHVAVRYSLLRLALAVLARPMPGPHHASRFLSECLGLIECDGSRDFELLLLDPASEVVRWFGTPRIAALVVRHSGHVRLIHSRRDDGQVLGFAVTEGVWCRLAGVAPMLPVVAECHVALGSGWHYYRVVHVFGLIQLARVVS